MHVVKPVSSLAATAQQGSITLGWTESGDSQLLGYHVYRSTSAAGPFDRLMPDPILQTNYTDSLPDGGAFTYMVRAIKMETSASGTYSNASHGIFISAAIPSASATPVDISNYFLAEGQIVFQCTGEIGQKFAVEFSFDLHNWTPLETNVLFKTTMMFTNAVSSDGAKFYRTRLAP